MKRFLMLTAVLLMLMGMGITTYAAESGESGQSADLISRLKESVSQDQQELISELMESPDEVIEFVREKLKNGELDSEEDIEEAIQEGEDKFDVSLTEEDKEKLLQVMQKIEELGLDPEKLLDQAQGLCEQLGDEVTSQAKEAVRETMENSITGFFQDMGKRIKGFLDSIFS